MPELIFRSDESFARRVALAPLALAELPYAAGAWLHRRMYEAGLRARVRLDARVVSIGNLAVGGSAKTPVAAFLARSLHARGVRVALLSRGVGGTRTRETCVVADGERILLAADEAGDEPVLLAASAPGVPVLAGVQRVALGRRAITEFGARVLLLDDGFQHHRLARDLDLVCLDARLGLGNGHVLPRGPLREPVSALSRAHALVFTRATPGDAPPPGASRLPAAVPQLRVGVRKLGLRPLAGGERAALATLRGARVGLLAAIARPDRLERELGELGAVVVEQRVFRDHHRYRRDDLAGLDPDLRWVTTAKDAVKLEPAWDASGVVTVLEEEVDARSGAALADFVAARLGL
ncbi:MAG: tetraacyldisaccharide 4'-kinase [Myxococcota bacterium]